MPIPADKLRRLLVQLLLRPQPMPLPLPVLLLLLLLLLLLQLLLLTPRGRKTEGWWGRAKRLELTTQHQTFDISLVFKFTF